MMDFERNYIVLPNQFIVFYDYENSLTPSFLPTGLLKTSR